MSLKVKLAKFLFPSVFKNELVLPEKNIDIASYPHIINKYKAKIQIQEGDSIHLNSKKGTYIVVNLVKGGFYYTSNKDMRAGKSPTYAPFNDFKCFYNQQV